MGFLKNVFAAQKLDAVIIGKGAPGATRIKRVRKVTVSVNPPNAVAGANVTVDVTVTGARAGDAFIAVPPATLEAGLVLKSITVPSNDTVRITLFNPTAGAIDGAALNWDLLHISLG